MKEIVQQLLTRGVGKVYSTCINIQSLCMISCSKSATRLNFKFITITYIINSERLYMYLRIKNPTIFHNYMFQVFRFPLDYHLQMFIREALGMPMQAYFFSLFIKQKLQNW